MDEEIIDFRKLENQLSLTEMKVEDVIDELENFKKLNNISDEKALKTLSFALCQEGTEWWSGAQAYYLSWSQAIEGLRQEFTKRAQLKTMFNVVHVLKTKPKGETPQDTSDKFRTSKEFLLNMSKEDLMVGMFMCCLTKDQFLQLEKREYFSIAEVEKEIFDLEKNFTSKKRSKPDNMDTILNRLPMQNSKAAIDTWLNNVQHDPNGPLPPSRYSPFHVKR
ncbi:hypothetical protein CHUAL_012362 [Chamberlinius hualienensis]